MSIQNISIISEIEAESLVGGGGCDTPRPLLCLTRELVGKIQNVADMAALCEGRLGRLFCWYEA